MVELPSIPVLNISGDTRPSSGLATNKTELMWITVNQTGRVLTFYEDVPPILCTQFIQGEFGGRNLPPPPPLM